MDALNISSYIYDFNFSNKQAKVIALWFKNEGANLSGETAAETVGWMLAQGWSVVSSGTRWTHINTATGETEYEPWYALSRYYLDAQLALQDLTNSYTVAYNEGRFANDRRYDDLIALYSATLSNSESVLASLQTDEDSYESYILSKISSMDFDYTLYYADIGDPNLDEWYTDARQLINDDYDSRVAAARAEMESTGWYSTSRWSTENTGIESDRTKAIAHLGVEKRKLDIDHRTNSYKLQVDMRKNVIAARDRLMAQLQGLQNDRLTIRNRIAEALAGIVERRTDSYPDIDKIGELVSNLGTGGTGSFSP